MHFVALDTNIVLDRASGKELVIDALEHLHRKQFSIIVSPTVLAELQFLKRNPLIQQLAHKALDNLSRWRIKTLIIPDEMIRDVASSKLRQLGFLPREEIADSLIIAEAGLLKCSILLTSDHHILEIPYQPFKLAMEEMELSAPLLEHPKNILHKFFR